MKIKDLPEMEKPYEKLENYGAEKLSDAELLAVVIKTGTKNYTAVQIAQQILKLDREQRGLTFLKNATFEELRKIKGLGRVKTIQIKAVVELASRMSKPQKILRKIIESPEDVARILMPDMQHEEQEVMKTLIMNTQNELLTITTNAIGTVNIAYVEVRDIFKDAMRYNASRIIIVHNHPSGNPTPSASDVKFSKKIKDAGELFGIELIDHIIIGNGSFNSLKRMKKF